VAGIGAVATDPDFRGQGLMKRLMGHLLVQMAKEDYALSLLWGERDLYGSYGYERALSLPQFHFQERTLRSFVPSQGLRPVRPSDLPLLKKLFEAHPFRAQRPEGYLASVLRKFRSGNAKPAWVLEREGRVCAYSVVLGPVSGGLTVAEWGGAAEDVACLWAGLLKTFKATYVSATLYPQGDLYEWARAKASSRTWTDQSCMIKVLDLYRVLKAFEPQLQKRYAIVGHRVHKTLFFRMEDGSGAGLECGRRLKVVKSRGRGKDLPLSSAETVRLLFGAGWPSGEIRSLMGGEGWLDGLFPLDWYWWRSDWF
jgi:hypothetical protein